MKFELEGAELETFKKWDEEHRKTCPVINNGKPYPSDATGFRLTFSFSPTGLGDEINVNCACGAKCDCTDVNSW